MNRTGLIVRFLSAVFSLPAVVGLVTLSFVTIDKTRAAAPPQGSLMALMVETIAPAAAIVWSTGYAEKPTDEDWTRMRAAAETLRQTSITVLAGGTLPEDKTKAASSVWKEWAEKYSELTARLQRAAQGREQPAVAAAGDEMVELCGGCHAAFPANLP